MPTKPIFGICLALSLIGCAAPRESFNDLREGMTQSEVEQKLGRPDSSSLRNGEQCSVYSLWRDFWNRRPSDYSDRYFVCYTDKKVSSYGRIGDEF
jgi:hypothetical protein